ncbi:MAG: hypothetical protein LBU95_01960, partial [Rikenellaceae bacterium]|nr:hypothetical protein [Rikenellaceae bacterium]
MMAIVLLVASVAQSMPSVPADRVQRYETGLSFRSHESNKDQRTSLDLSSGGEFPLDDYLLLEFDARIRSQSERYGYLFKIEAGGRNIDLLLNNHPYTTLSLQLHYNRQLAQQSIHGQDGADFFLWNRYRLEFICSDSALVILYNGAEVVRDRPLERGKKQTVRIVFGADYAPGRVTYDVAPFELRMVSLCSRKKHSYVWPLDVHYTNQNVYDTLRRRAARVLNPDWLIDRHTQWKHTRTMDFP